MVRTEHIFQFMLLNKIPQGPLVEQAYRQRSPTASPQSLRMLTISVMEIPLETTEQTVSVTKAQRG